jgi:hypothetical protein
MSKVEKEKSFVENQDQKHQDQKHQDQKHQDQKQSPVPPDSEVPNPGFNKYGLKLSELRELREIFSLVDRDGGGTISPEELKALMQTLGLKSNQVNSNL